VDADAAFVSTSPPVGEASVLKNFLTRLSIKVIGATRISSMTSSVACWKASRLA
jgi:hypothetical protein